MDYFVPCLGRNRSLVSTNSVLPLIFRNFISNRYDVAITLQRINLLKARLLNTNDFSVYLNFARAFGTQLLTQ